LISTILHRLTTNVQSCLPISPAPGKQKQQYLSIFCPVFDKEIQLSFKNKYEQTTIVKYGWTMFYICSGGYRDLSQWSICPTQKPNEITIVSCNKPNSPE
jgi:hypothetical protein